MARETELGFKIKRVLSDNDQWKKIVKETEAFYDRLESNPAELDIGDIKHTIVQLQQVRSEYNKINSDANSNRGQIEFANTLCDVLDRAEDKFSDIGVMFKNVNDNTRKYVTGLSNITNHLADSNFGVKFLDVGAQFEVLQSRAEDLYNTLKTIGTDTYDGGEFSLWSGSFDKHDLRDRIDVLRELQSVQEEMLDFDSEMRSRDFISGQSVSGLENFIIKAQNSLELLRKSGLETTEELEKLRSNFEYDMGWSGLWDDDEFKRAKENFTDDEVYNKSIQNLKSYISEREDLLERLDSGFERNLFLDDEIESMGSTLRRELSDAQDQLKVLESLRGKDIGPDFSEVVTALNEIKDAIREIKDAFDPLTQAFANEDSAISKMVNANVEDLNRLQEKFEQVFRDIQTLSQKEFSSQTTHVVQQTINAPGGVLKTQRAELKELAKMLGQYQSAIGSLNSKSNIFKKIGLSASGQLDFFSFDLNEVLAGLKKATTADKLDGWADVLDDYKKGIIAIANEINKIQSGLVNLDPLQNQKKKDPDILNLGQASSNVDGILTEVKSIRDQIDSEIQGIRTSFESIFKFDSLNPNFDNIKSITEKIYQQFVELQSKINALDFNINASNITVQTSTDKTQKTNVVANDSSNEINNEARAMHDVKVEAIEAATAKEKFTHANKEVKSSAEVSVAALKEESNAAEEVAISVQKAASKLEVSQDEIVKKYKEIYGGNKNVKDTIAQQFNKVLESANVDASSITASFSEKKETVGTGDNKQTYWIDVIKLVAQYTDEAGKANNITKEYDISTGRLIKQMGSFKDVKDTFNIAQEIETANSKVAELEKRMGSFKINLEGVKKAAKNITDASSLTVFEKELEGANQKLKEIKATLKSSKSLDPIVNSENMVANLETTVKTYRENIKKLSGVEGFSELKCSLEVITTKLNEFNKAKKDSNGAEMASAVAEINKEITKYNANLKLVNERYKENNRVAKENTNTERQRIAEENAAWAEYRAEQEAAAEKERQINLAFSQKAAQEAAEAERELAQARKEANEYFTAVEKQEQKEEEARKVKELNALYRERNTIITAIIKYNNKASTLKTDKAIQRAKDQLELEKQRLAAIDDAIDKYGELINLSKLEQQNDRLTSRLRDSNVTNAITKEQKQDIEDVNRLLGRRKEVHDNILKLQKQLNNASGDEERKAIQQEIDGQNTIYKALTKKLAIYKDIALQKKVTEQDNKFREQDSWNQIRSKINTAADADKADLEDQKQNYKDILNLVEQLFDAQTALHKINTDPTDKVHTAEREKEIKNVKELSMLLKEIYGIDIKNLTGSLDKNALLTQEQKNELLEKERDYKKEIVDLTADAADKEADLSRKEAERKRKKVDTEKQNYGKSAFNSLEKFSDSMHASIRELQSGGAVSATLDGLVAEFDAAYSKVEAMRKQFNENPASVTPELKTQFQDSVRNAENLRQKITDIFKESQKLQKIGSFITAGYKDVSQLQDLKSEMIAFANSLSDGEVKINGFNKEGTEMYVTLNQGADAVENVTIALDKASGHLQAFSTGTSKATNEWEDFKTQAVAGAKNLIGMYVGFQEGVQAVRKGVEYVKEIDLAMTELKKVTDETDASYKQFLKDAGSTSAVIGSTISDFTEATATFARLGYSMEESSSMAETAIIYKNVADGLDSVEESSDSIISTMMAFGIEANDTMSIIDRFNAVGNNFAITSAGIGEALQRSASALYSAGNTIDESVALVTAAM